MIEVTKDTPVEVGKFYLVRCAVVVAPREARKYTCPIIGHEHKDVQFGVSYKHYHIDGRFVNPKTWGFNNINQDGTTNRILATKPNVPYHYSEYIESFVIKKIKCRRGTTGINAPEHAVKYWGWYQEQIGKRCAGKKCPHYGHNMHEVNGQLVCPLHGLTASIKTNRIIKPKNFPKNKAVTNTIILMSKHAL